MELKQGNYAVIFTSIRHVDDEEYQQTFDELMRLANETPGFIAMDSARSGLGISVSYWENEDAIKKYRELAFHKIAQQKGREKWYENYTVTVAKIERSYSFKK